MAKRWGSKRGKLLSAIADGAAYGPRFDGCCMPCTERIPHLSGLLGECKRPRRELMG